MALIEGAGDTEEECRFFSASPVTSVRDSVRLLVECTVNQPQRYEACFSECTIMEEEEAPECCCRTDPGAPRCRRRATLDRCGEASCRAPGFLSRSGRSHR